MKLAIITGGSKGLGKALCERYLFEGWQVVEFSRSGVSDYSVPADLSDPECAAAIFSETFARLSQERYEEVVAISNAGVVEPIAQVGSLPVSGIESNMAINLTGSIVFAHAFVAAFQDVPCRKTFVAISSGAAVKGYSGWSLYCASKAGLEHFVRSLAIEQMGKDHPISSININPSIMDTDMQARIRSSSAADFPSVERFRAFKAENQLRSPVYVAQRLAEIIDANPEPGSTQSVS